MHAASVRREGLGGWGPRAIATSTRVNTPGPNQAEKQATEQANKQSNHAILDFFLHNCDWLNFFEDEQASDQVKPASKQGQASKRASRATVQHGCRCYRPKRSHVTPGRCHRQKRSHVTPGPCYRQKRSHVTPGFHTGFKIQAQKAELRNLSC